MAGSWHLGPVVRGLRGHRAAAALVILQLGVGLAVTVLAALIGEYFARVNAQPSGLADDDLTLVALQLPGRSAGPAAEQRRAEVVAEIAQTPGCEGVVTLEQIPLAIGDHTPDDVRRTPDGPPVRAYELDVGPGFAQVSGLRLRAGRDLSPADLAAHDVTAAIISRSFARALWPDRDPVGERFWSRSHGPAVVVAVAETLRAQLIGSAAISVAYGHDASQSARILLLVRSTPGRADDLRAALHGRLRRPGEDAEISAAGEHMRAIASSVGSVLGMLAMIVGAMVLVVLIGSMGLTYSLVADRTREIGLRRAMGATRRDIVRYFLLENAILTAAGACVGFAIVVAVLPTMARSQPGFALRWPVVAAAVSVVIGLNMLATLIPARRAAAVPPIVASRAP